MIYVALIALGAALGLGTAWLILWLKQPHTLETRVAELDELTKKLTDAVLREARMNEELLKRNHVLVEDLGKDPESAAIAFANMGDDSQVRFLQAFHNEVSTWQFHQRVGQLHAVSEKLNFEQRFQWVRYAELIKEYFECQS